MAGKTERRPWTKWYWSDWKADQALRACSLTARGLWAEMLSIMDKAEPYGYLLINGKPITDQQLANQAGGGVTARQVATLLQELGGAGVYSTDAETGFIYCRRMLRDKAKHDEDVANGKGGGNPNLKKQDNGGVNPQANGGDKGGDKAHMPEARSHKPDADSSGRTKAEKLSPNWKPSDEDRSYAKTKNLTDIEIDEEAIAFVRYWTGPDAKNAAKKDWHRTWCNRIDEVCGRIIARRPRAPMNPGFKAEIGAPREINRIEWEAYYRGYVKTEGRVWPLKAGAKPGEAGCQCPADVIAAVDAERLGPMLTKLTGAA